MYKFYEIKYAIQIIRLYKKTCLFLNQSESHCIIPIRYYIYFFNYWANKWKSIILIVHIAGTCGLEKYDYVVSKYFRTLVIRILLQSMIYLMTIQFYLTWDIVEIFYYWDLIIFNNILLLLWAVFKSYTTPCQTVIIFSIHFH